VINNLTEIKDRSSTTQASVHLRQPHIYQHLSTQRSTCRISFIISVRLNQDGSNPWSSTSSFNESLIYIQVSDAEAVIISVRLNDRLRSYSSGWAVLLFTEQKNIRLLITSSRIQINAQSKNIIYI
jgi:hypothetical protein